MYPVYTPIMGDQSLFDGAPNNAMFILSTASEHNNGRDTTYFTILGGDVFACNTNSAASQGINTPAAACSGWAVDRSTSTMSKLLGYVAGRIVANKTAAFAARFIDLAVSKGANRLPASRRLFGDSALWEQAPDDAVLARRLSQDNVKYYKFDGEIPMVCGKDGVYTMSKYTMYGLLETFINEGNIIFAIRAPVTAVQDEQQPESAEEPIKVTIEVEPATNKFNVGDDIVYRGQIKGTVLFVDPEYVGGHVGFQYYVSLPSGGSTSTTGTPVEWRGFAREGQLSKYETPDEIKHRL